MSKRFPRRRIAGQWQELIDQWQQSGLSAKQFCDEQGLGYASFCQWRKRLAETETAKATAPKTPEASFFGLASLGAAGADRWNIVLSLGNGVELKLSQA